MNKRDKNKNGFIEVLYSNAKDSGPLIFHSAGFLVITLFNFPISIRPSAKNDDETKYVKYSSRSI